MIITLPNNYELKIYINKQEKRVGICSDNIKNTDRHCLLWDFDNANLENIRACLKYMQKEYQLPNIYIAKSSSKNYHAYSFVSLPFLRTIHILSGTPFIDETYLRLGIVRGYFTLRISPRHNDKLEYIECLTSDYPSEMNPLDLMTNEYLTSNKGEHNAKTRKNTR